MSNKHLDVNAKLVLTWTARKSDYHVHAHFPYYEGKCQNISFHYLQLAAFSFLAMRKFGPKSPKEK